MQVTQAKSIIVILSLGRYRTRGAFFELLRCRVTANFHSVGSANFRAASIIAIE